MGHLGQLVTHGEHQGTYWDILQTSEGIREDMGVSGSKGTHVCCSMARHYAYTLGCAVCRRHACVRTSFLERRMAVEAAEHQAPHQFSEYFECHRYFHYSRDAEFSDCSEYSECSEHCECVRPAENCECSVVF